MQELINKKAFKEKKIYIGIDVHKTSWKVTIMLDEITHKTFSQDPNSRILAEYLQRNFPGGTYLSAYEAGFCGFSVHRALLNEGTNNIVVNPADIPVTDKEKRQKEDKRDSRKIARGLRNSELVAIHVLAPEHAVDVEDPDLVEADRLLVEEVGELIGVVEVHGRTGRYQDRGEAARRTSVLSPSSAGAARRLRRA